jgi:hypothetical protein
MNNILDLYTDYLISSTSFTTCTGLSKMLDGEISHDKINRMLATVNHSSSELWSKVKPLVREHENEEACLVFDDTIFAKPYTDENDINTYHYDHAKKETVKGINVLTTFYITDIHDQDASLRLPIAYNIIHKPIVACDISTKKEIRKSPATKNEMMRAQLDISIQNNVKFKYVLADSWFASNENMKYINKLKKIFIFDIKSNRLASIFDRNKGKWLNINKLSIEESTPIEVWLKDLEIRVLLFKQVFINKDGSRGERFLVSNDLELSKENFINIYKKRWSVEEYHKSLKQNSSATKSPARTVQTISAHLYASLLAYVKLENYKLKTKMNHFMMKGKLYMKALKSAFRELEEFKQKFSVNLDFA